MTKQAAHVVPEVSLFFENYLMRGNRTSKISADQFSAFESYNYPHLAYAGIEIRYHDAVIANAHMGAYAFGASIL